MMAEMKSIIIKYSLLLGIIIITISCLDKRDEPVVKTHPPGWVIQTSDQFHGKIALSDTLRVGFCKTCHGNNYMGGTSQVSCYDVQCHNIYPHPADFAVMGKPDFHGNGNLIRDVVHWDITTCQTCHGTDYAGNGSQKKNCLRCHTETNGPEACNTCHGSLVNPAPPKDLSGGDLTTSIGVGAHQAHLGDSTLTTAYNRDCNLCHITPAVFDMAGHVNDSSPYAEINFGSIASDSGKVTPTWDHDNATCSNVYCHGDFTFNGKTSAYPWVYEAPDSVISGNNVSVIWNSVGTGQADCNTCHGLPPKGHFQQITECEKCHYGYGPNFTIIDKKHHIDGKVEVY